MARWYFWGKASLCHPGRPSTWDLVILLPQIPNKLESQAKITTPSFRTLKLSIYYDQNQNKVKSKIKKVTTDNTTKREISMQLYAKNNTSNKIS